MSGPDGLESDADAQPRSITQSEQPGDRVALLRQLELLKQQLADSEASRAKLLREQSAKQPSVERPGRTMSTRGSPAPEHGTQEPDERGEAPKEKGQEDEYARRAFVHKRLQDTKQSVQNQFQDAVSAVFGQWDITTAVTSIRLRSVADVIMGIHGYLASQRMCPAQQCIDAFLQYCAIPSGRTMAVFRDSHHVTYDSLLAMEERFCRTPKSEGRLFEGQMTVFYITQAVIKCLLGVAPASALIKMFAAGANHMKNPQSIQFKTNARGEALSKDTKKRLCTQPVNASQLTVLFFIRAILLNHSQASLQALPADATPFTVNAEEARPHSEGLELYSNSCHRLDVSALHDYRFAVLNRYDLPESVGPLTKHMVWEAENFRDLHDLFTAHPRMPTLATASVPAKSDASAPQNQRQKNKRYGDENRVDDHKRQRYEHRNNRRRDSLPQSQDKPTIEQLYALVEKMASQQKESKEADEEPAKKQTSFGNRGHNREAHRQRQKDRDNGSGARPRDQKWTQH